MYTPDDSYRITQTFEQAGYGACGMCVVAIALKTNVQKVWAEWTGGYRGYANFSEVEKELRNRRFEVKRKRGNKSKTFILPKGYDKAIARIQWEGDWKHWAEAQQHTHYVFVERFEGKTMIFCNAKGWFEDDGTYLNNGYITSYLVWNY